MSVETVAISPASHAKSDGRWRTVLGFAPTVVVALALCLVFYRYGTSAGDLAGYAGRVVAGVLFPGIVLHRLLRSGERSLLEDAAIGFAIGTVAQLPVWWLCVQLDVSFWWWPALVAVTVGITPGLRRRVADTVATPMPFAWSWAVAGICLIALAWMTGDFIRWTPAHPGDGHTYYQDLVYHLGIASELTRQVPPTDPYVAGEPLYYHWLGHLDMAVAARASGVELTSTIFQLWAPVLLLSSICMVTVVATRLSGHLWAGPIAATLLYCASEIGLREWTFNYFTPMVQFFWWASSSQAIATMLTVAAALFFCDYLRHGKDAAANFWRIGLPIMVLLPLAKASVIPLFGAGAGFVLLVSLARRDRGPTRRALIGCLVTSAILGLSTLVLYGGSSQSLQLANPSAAFVRYAKALVPASMDPRVETWAFVVSVAVAACLWATSVLGRLVGIGLLARRWRSLDAAQVCLLGALVGGIVGYVMTSHPAGSNSYFIIGAFPLGAILSAWGICSVLPALTTRQASVLVAAAASCGVLAYFNRSFLGGTREKGGPHISDQILSAVRPFAITAALVVAVAIGLVIAHRLGWGRSLRVGHIVVAAVIAAGLPTTMIFIFSSAYTSGSTKARANMEQSQATITGDSVAAARWLRAHSADQDIVATNRHCLTGTWTPGAETPTCGVADFWIAGYTERRALVEGWGFSTKSHVRAAETDGRPQLQPFWDQAKLADNEDFFASPSAATSRNLCERDVSWAFVDRRWDPDTPSLERVADLRFKNTDAEVYELRC